MMDDGRSIAVAAARLGPRTSVLVHSVQTTQAVDERLAHSCRGDVLLTFTGHQLEGGAEFGVQRLRGVPSDLKPAATCWAVVREGRHEDEPADANSLPHLRDIAGSVGRRCEKVERSTVMPDGISGRRKRRIQNIGLDPSYDISPRAETTTGYGECGGREIEDREIVIASVQQVIDQS